MPALADGNVFVLSLNTPGNPRREHMRRLLHGVTFEFVDGVIVQNVDRDLESWCASRHLPTPMTSTFFQPKPGDLGVLLAFLQVWETIVSRGLPYAFVLEDDVVANASIDVFRHQVAFAPDVDLAFLHPYGGFGMYITYVTLAGARKLVAARERFIALDKPVDLSLWEGDLPEVRMVSSCGSADWLFVQASPLNDVVHSQRVAVNERATSQPLAPTL